MGRLRSFRVTVSRKQVCFSIFNIGIIMLALWFICADFFYAKRDLYVQILQSIIVFVHLLLKYFSFLYHKKNIENVLRGTAYKLWTHQYYDRRISQSIERTYKTIEKIQALMFTGAIIYVLIYFVKAFFLTNGLILESFIPSSVTMDGVVLFSQFYCFYLCVTIILGYDYLYIALCVHVIVQLRLLKEKIKEIVRNNYDDFKLKIGKCIRHHQFLFTMFTQLNEIYSLMLLFHYFITLVTACGLLLEFFMRRPTFMSYIEKILTVLMAVLEFGIYAFPAKQVALEFTDISDAIYTSNWYKSNIKHQKILLYVMLVAQRISYFSGAGLMDINVDTFESVLRKAFSISLIFKNLIDK